MTLSSLSKLEFHFHYQTVNTLISIQNDSFQSNSLPKIQKFFVFFKIRVKKTKDSITHYCMKKYFYYSDFDSQV